MSTACPPTTTIPYTTTTVPPYIPPIGSDGCLRLFYTCECVGDTSIWSPVFRDCVPNSACGGGLVCDSASYYNEYVNGCVIGDDPPTTHDPLVPPCGPNCCGSPFGPSIGYQCAQQDWVCDCGTGTPVWVTVAPVECVDNSLCTDGSNGDDLSYHMEQIDGCFLGAPIDDAPGITPPITVGDCCTTTTQPPPQCEAKWQAVCAAGKWGAPVVIDSNCVDICGPVDWAPADECTQVALTCTEDKNCVPGSICIVPEADLNQPNPLLRVPVCCTTTTTAPPPYDGQCQADWTATCSQGSWSVALKSSICTNGCGPVAWAPSDQCTQSSRTCSADARCTEGYACTAATTTTPPPPAAVPPCCTTTTSTTTTTHTTPPDPLCAYLESLIGANPCVLSVTVTDYDLGTQNFALAKDSVDHYSGSGSLYDGGCCCPELSAAVTNPEGGCTVDYNGHTYTLYIPNGGLSGGGPGSGCSNCGAAFSGDVDYYWLDEQYNQVCPGKIHVTFDLSVSLQADQGCGPIVPSVLAGYPTCHYDADTDTSHISFVIDSYGPDTNYWSFCHLDYLPGLVSDVTVDDVNYPLSSFNMMQGDVVVPGCAHTFKINFNSDYVSPLGCIESVPIIDQTPTYTLSCDCVPCPCDGTQPDAHITSGLDGLSYQGPMPLETCQLVPSAFPNRLAPVSGHDNTAEWGTNFPTGSTLAGVSIEVTCNGSTSPRTYSVKVTITGLGAVTSTVWEADVSDGSLTCVDGVLTGSVTCLLSRSDCVAYICGGMTAGCADDFPTPPSITVSFG